MDGIAVICSVAKHSSVLDEYNSFHTGMGKKQIGQGLLKQVLSVVAIDFQSSQSFILYIIFELYISIARVERLLQDSCPELT